MNLPCKTFFFFFFFTIEFQYLGLQREYGPLKESLKHFTLSLQGLHKHHATIFTDERKDMNGWSDG